MSGLRSILGDEDPYNPCPTKCAVIALALVVLGAVLMLGLLSIPGARDPVADAHDRHALRRSEIDGASGEAHSPLRSTDRGEVSGSAARMPTPGMMRPGW